ncbi:hypothetical protein HY418_01150 [Candidatus Kaiserbacteria bacterium]|nr:hypothetical protein [Candidatus Kaiserbacteria bacterium]
MLYRVLDNARLVLSGVGFVGAIFLPPWVPLLAMLLLSLRYSAWEIPAIGFFVDILWLAPSSGGFFASLPIFTLAGLVLLWLLEPLRREFLTR